MTAASPDAGECIPRPASAGPAKNLGSLMRLFQSEYFDAHLHMHYLLRMEQSGVQDYLVNQLYKMNDDDVDFYLPQLCQLALVRYERSSLHRFLLDKASRSMHFALKIYWFVLAAVEDRSPELLESAQTMLSACEAALVNAPAPEASASAARPRARSTSETLLAESRSLRRARSCPDFSALLADAAADKEATFGRQTSQDCSPRRGRPRDDHDAEILRRRSVTEDNVGRLSVASRKGASEGAQPPGSGEVLAHLAALSRETPPEVKAAAFGLPANVANAYAELGDPLASQCSASSPPGAPEGESQRCMLKQRRADFFDTQNRLVAMIAKMSVALAAIAEKEERKATLAAFMHLLNRWLLDRRAFMALNEQGPLGLLGLHVPLMKGRDTARQILCIHVEQCRIFASATRAPCLVVLETADLDEVTVSSGSSAGGSAAARRLNHQRSHTQSSSMANLLSAAETTRQAAASEPLAVLARSITEPLALTVAGELGSAGAAGAFEHDSASSALRRQLKRMTAEEWLAVRCSTPAAPPPAPPVPSRCRRCPHAEAWRDIEDTATGSSDSLSGCPPRKAPEACGSCRLLKRSEEAQEARRAVWGEPWEERKKRMRLVSPFAALYRSWTLEAMFVKGGDDLRQELLACQVIKQFSAIFREAGLPLWLKDLEVLVVSSSAGFMEFIHDTTSVDGLKKQFPGKSLAEIFRTVFADRLFEAKQNFIESFAAYSLVIYFLQVKDRHNGNLMLDSSGHIIHIDFGFMLSNSPGGNIAFEQAPFKLTQEFLDVMNREWSDQFEYFRTLVVRGFLEARKHVDRIVLPIRMVGQGSRLPCFREGLDWVMETLQDRFFLNLTEEGCIEKIMDLIDASLNNWRTIQYDNLQRVVNGIL